MKSSEVRIIKKKWIQKQREEECHAGKNVLQQKFFPAKVFERMLLTKRLRMVVAASVALIASIMIHPNLAVLIIPVSSALYAREIHAFLSKRSNPSKNSK
jgi:hypothetical protein